MTATVSWARRASRHPGAAAQPTSSQRLRRRSARRRKRPPARSTRWRAWESARRSRGHEGGNGRKRAQPAELGRGISTRRTLEREIGVPVRVGNDVDVAVEAEAALGAGRPFRTLLGLWWGTGVGGAIMIERKRWLGRGAAGEIGHTVVKLDGAPCPCGRRGCLEAYAGRGAMELRARRAVKHGAKTSLFKLMEKHGRTRLTSSVWQRALEQHDELAERLIDRAIRALGAAAASAINLIDLEAVVVGGGLGTRLGEDASRRIRCAMEPHLFLPDRPPEVRLSELGDLGGAIGAARLLT